MTFFDAGCPTAIDSWSGPASKKVISERHRVGFATAAEEIEIGDVGVAEFVDGLDGWPAASRM